METAVRNLTIPELEAGLDDIRQSPRDQGVLKMIVRRPAVGAREILEQGELDTEKGLVGDNWSTRGSRMTDDGRAHPKMQLNIMNARAAALLAQTEERWSLAGDQLFIDFDLSAGNVPPGTRIALGSAMIEVTDQPHTGCGKFVSRFGVEATKFVNSSVGRELQLRGINARVVQPGTIKVGDAVRKIAGGSHIPS
jgi:hypothetical protein